MGIETEGAVRAGDPQFGPNMGGGGTGRFEEFHGESATCQGIDQVIHISPERLKIPGGVLEREEFTKVAQDLQSVINTIRSDSLKNAPPVRIQRNRKL